MFDRLRQPQVAIGVAGLGSTGMVSAASLIALDAGVDDRLAVLMLFAGAVFFAAGLALLVIGPRKESKGTTGARHSSTAISNQQSGGMTVATQNVGVQANTFGAPAKDPEPPLVVTVSASTDCGYVFVENPGIVEKVCVRIRAFDASNPGYELRAVWRTGEEERELKKGDKDWCLIMRLEPDRVRTGYASDGTPTISIFKQREYAEQQLRYRSELRALRFVGLPQERDLHVGANGQEYEFEVVALSNSRDPVVERLGYAVVGDTLVLPFEQGLIDTLMVERQEHIRRAEEMLGKQLLSASEEVPES